MVAKAMNAEAIAARIRGLTLETDPWPHGVLDDFLPPAVFAELLASLPRSRTTKLPQSALALLTSPVILAACRERFGFAGGQVLRQIRWFGPAGLKAHEDRPDKLWNGQVYLAGDPKGTELYDGRDQLARVVEWRPNRFTCWAPPGRGLKHAAPSSSGRHVLLWWILQDAR
jgi:hypothetical protein